MQWLIFLSGVRVWALPRLVVVQAGWTALASSRVFPLHACKSLGGCHAVSRWQDRRKENMEVELCYLKGSSTPHTSRPLTLCWKELSHMAAHLLQEGDNTCRWTVSSLRHTGPKYLLLKGRKQKPIRGK